MKLDFFGLPLYYQSKEDKAEFHKALKSKSSFGYKDTDFIKKEADSARRLSFLRKSKKQRKEVETNKQCGTDLSACKTTENYQEMQPFFPESIL